jgi:uncharacterized phage protein (TIGR01671 family)
MREIIFRGKDIYAKEWVEGSLILYKKPVTARTLEDSFENHYYIVPFDMGYRVEVDPKTIEQWTGRTDKNGVKIFESVDKTTDDVVPREDVVELENKLAQYERVCGKLIVKDGVGIGLLPDGKETVYILKSIASVTKELAIRRTRQEVARAIFEDIEELFFKNGNFIHIHIHSYNEFKKRYVPEATDILE